MRTLYSAHKWRRDDVDWGDRGVRGRLVGYIYTTERDIDLSYNYYGFYFLYYNDRIVYTSNSWERYDSRYACIYDILKDHTKRKKIEWNMFSFLVIKTQDGKFNGYDMLYFASAILNLIKDNYEAYTRIYKGYDIVKLAQLPKK